MASDKFILSIFDAESSDDDIAAEKVSQNNKGHKNSDIKNQDEIKRFEFLDEYFSGSSSSDDEIENNFVLGAGNIDAVDKEKKIDLGKNARFQKMFDSDSSDDEDKNIIGEIIFEKPDKKLNAKKIRSYYDDGNNDISEPDKKINVRETQIYGDDESDTDEPHEPPRMQETQIYGNNKSDTYEPEEPPRMKQTQIYEDDESEDDEPHKNLYISKTQIYGDDESEDDETHKNLYISKTQIYGDDESEDDEAHKNSHIRETQIYEDEESDDDESHKNSHIRETQIYEDEESDDDENDFEEPYKNSHIRETQIYNDNKNIDQDSVKSNSEPQSSDSEIINLFIDEESDDNEKEKFGGVSDYNISSLLSDENNFGDINNTKKGGSSTKKINEVTVEKPEEIAKIIPEKITECSIWQNKKDGEPCISEEVFNIVRDITKVGETNDKKTAMELIKEKTNCDSERCVLIKLKDKIGPEKVKEEIKLRLKIQGPTDSSLLSNVDIDSTLKQWKKIFPQFYAYNFNMIDFEINSFSNGNVINKPDSLATVDIRDLYKKGYRCAACVINSDKYEGPGKHWMALFVSFGNPSEFKNPKIKSEKESKDNIKNGGTDSEAPFSVEFFNSAGNPPTKVWIRWMVKTFDQLNDLAEKEAVSNSTPRRKVEMINVTEIRHQNSKSECGTYALFYIWSRLHNVPAKYFIENRVPDQITFEFRQHLFDSGDKEDGVTAGKFDWSKYQDKTKIIWE